MNIGLLRKAIGITMDKDVKELIKEGADTMVPGTRTVRQFLDEPCGRAERER